ncbi:Hypothetical predicted protein [Podarcis lilfordi]|uniref:Uncharacterized protein n=1 Tax=Podarcis lilfordi TaxID=74358 RepID=A0AA35KG89_9SAUR|nr:Hypothetical predicted protein [Podarcis lilfordi]
MEVPGEVGGACAPLEPVTLFASSSALSLPRQRRQRTEQNVSLRAAERSSFSPATGRQQERFPAFQSGSTTRPPVLSGSLAALASFGKTKEQNRPAPPSFARIKKGHRYIPKARPGSG